VNNKCKDKDKENYGRKNNGFHKMWGIFLTTWEPVSFSRRTLFYGVRKVGVPNLYGTSQAMYIY
jgi:hypothetical protein